MAGRERYAELADKIVDLLGGRDNIGFFTHCVTRLRFNLKDKNLVRKEKIEKIPGVMGSQWSGDQYQVIIGQAVSDAYALIAEKTGLGAKEGAGEKGSGDCGKKRKFRPGDVLDAISGSITPLMPLLIGAGFIKIIVLVCTQLGLLAEGDPTHTILSLVGDAGFYFLPVFVGATAARKFNANIGLGMLVGAMLIHPSFIEAVNAGGALNICGIPIYGASYTSSVIPALLAVAVMAPVERFFARISPDMIRSITEPLLTLIVMIPLTFCLLAPIGAFLGTYLSAAIMWLYDTVGFVAVAVFACLCPWIVMTGMHTAMLPYMFDTFAKGLPELIITPGMLVSNIDQGVANLVVAIKSKDENMRSTAASCAVTAVLGGVTEPGMFGVNLRFKTPMYGAMIGSAAGGLVTGLMGAGAQALTTSTGLIGGFPVFISSNPMNLVGIIAGVAVGAVVTFIATYLLFKPEQAETAPASERGEAAVPMPVQAAPTQGRGAETLLQPVAGTPVDLVLVNDQTFASGMMGAGVAVEPSEGVLVAPAAGVVTVMFPTGHAVGITTDAGNELLLHIGIDTVSLEGRGFSPKVSQGQRVRAGDVLVEFDVAAIRAAGYDPTTTVLVSDTTADDVIVLSHDAATAGVPLLALRVAKEA